MGPSDSKSFDASDPTFDPTIEMTRGDVADESLVMPAEFDGYKIEAKLGHGGMGVVYLATDKELGRRVALKKLKNAHRQSPMQVKRFQLEARAAAQLSQSHDHIVPIHHVGEHQGIHYFTMRYIDGSDLAQVVRAAQLAMQDLSHGSADTQVLQDSKGRSNRAGESTVPDHTDTTNDLIDLSADSFVRSVRSSGTRSAHKLALSVALIGEVVADALHHAHQHGIVHRDIKPHNLMLDHTNKIWVTDFGLAQLRDSPDRSRDGVVLGTMRYMSPEQATGRRAFIDHRTDIYSLGVTLYELATLQKACRGEDEHEVMRSITFERPTPIRKINPKLPRDLETILCKATERNPSDRYQTAAEMAADLRRFANSESLLARRPSPLKIIRNWIWDRPALSAMALAMLLVIAGSMTAVAIATQRNNTIIQAAADDAKRALTTREGQHLLASGQLQAIDNPGLAVAAALEGVKAAPGPSADRALMAAVDQNHELRTIPLGFLNPGSCAVSADGTRAVLCRNPSGPGDKRNEATIVDLQTGKVAGNLKSDDPIAAAFYIDGDHFLLTSTFPTESRWGTTSAGNASGSIKVWDPKTLAVIKSFPVNGLVRLSSDNISLAHQQIVVPNTDNSATVYNLAGFAQAMVLPRRHDQPVVECRFSPDGTKILTWSLDSKAIVWDAKTGRDLLQVEYPCQQPEITKVFFSADSQKICISGDKGSRFVTCVGERKEFFRLERIAGLSTHNNCAYLYGTGRASALILNTDLNVVMKECRFNETAVDVISLAEDRYIAAILDDSIVVYSVASGNLVARLNGHSDYIESMSAVGNENQLVSLGHDGTLRHWHVQSDLDRRVLPTVVEPYTPSFVSQSPDGRRALVATARRNETQALSLKTVAPTSGSIEGEYLLQLSDGQVLTTTADGIYQWDVATQRKTGYAILESSSPYRFPLALEVPRSDRVAVLSGPGDIFLWNRNSNQLDRKTKPTERATAMAIDRSGENLLYVSVNGELVSVSLIDDQRKQLAVFTEVPYNFDLHPEREEIVLTCHNSVPLLWRPGNAEVITRLNDLPASTMAANYVTNDRIVMLAKPHRVVLWSVSDQKIIKTIEVKDANNLEVNATKNKVVITGQSGVHLWDLDTDEDVRVLDGPCKLATFVGDKLVIATGSYALRRATQASVLESQKLIVWDCASRKIERTEPIKQHVTKVVPTKPQDQFLISSYTFGTECIDLATNRSIARFMEHTQPLVLASFLDDSNSVLTVSRDGLIALDKLPSGQRITLGTHTYPIDHAALSPDRRLLLTSDQVDGINYWDVVARKLIRNIKTGDKQVTRLDFNKTSTRAVVVLDQDTIKSWDLRTNVEVELAVAEGVRDLAISRDGRALLVATGLEEVYPAHPMFLAEELAKGAVPVVLKIDLITGERVRLQTEGMPVNCAFADNDKKLVVLNTLGNVQLFESESLQALGKIATDRRIMQLLEPPLGSPWLFTAAKKRIAAWSPVDGSLQLDVALDINEGESALRIPRQSLNQPPSDVMLLYRDRRFIKYPIHAAEYAKKIAPRSLSTEERNKLLNLNFEK